MKHTEDQTKMRYGATVKYKIVYSFFVFITSIHFVHADEVGEGKSTRNVSAKVAQFYDKYTPVQAVFSTNRKKAESLADPEWRKLNKVDRAKYSKGVLEELIKYKGLTYLPANLMVCIINMESEYIPNWRTPTKGSTASGLGQVTNTTLKGLLSQRWFSPIMPGFSKDMSASQYREASAKSIIEQLNLIMSTLHLKRVESGSTNLTTLLHRYRGADKKTNQAYANKIMNCKNCVDKNGVTAGCLKK